jgi:hypothetical protein
MQTWKLEYEYGTWYLVTNFCIFLVNGFKHLVNYFSSLYDSDVYERTIVKSSFRCSIHILIRHEQLRMHKNIKFCVLVIICVWRISLYREELPREKADSGLINSLVSFIVASSEAPRSLSKEVSPY